MRDVALAQQILAHGEAIVQRATGGGDPAEEGRDRGKGVDTDFEALERTVLRDAERHLLLRRRPGSSNKRR